MSLCRVLKNFNKWEEFNYRNSRFLCISAAPRKSIKEIKRKYLKQTSPQKLKPWPGSYFLNLFAGFVDKKVLKYPAIFSEDGFDTVLNQSTAVENFFRSNQDSELTNDIIRDLRELELFGLTVPQEFGGAGYSETETKFLLECTGCNPKIARFIGYKEDFGCRLMNFYGTKEQKYKYLPDLAEGKRFMTLAYLENHPLIDLSKQEGFAIFDYESKEYILEAEKKWVHYADKADLFLVMAKLGVLKQEDLEYKLKFSMFLVDKNTPGVTVHKLKSPWANEANLFQVSFKGVRVPTSDVLGGAEVNGFDILKYGLSNSNLTDATLCLSLMKKIFHDALQFVQENSLKTMNTKGHLHVRENISTFVSYIYMLESVVYLLSGSVDKYDKPDLFHDAVMAKILGIDFLRLGIQLYTEIVGRDSFKKTRVIEAAFNAVQYNSVFDENIEYFKLMSAAEGLVFVSNQLARKIKVAFNAYENPYEMLKTLFFKKWDEKKFKSELKLKMELHSSLSISADIIEENVLNLRQIIENLYLKQGNLALNCEHSVITLAETASYLFAAIAGVSRASASVCYDINNFKNEAALAQIFTRLVSIKIRNIYEEDHALMEIIEGYRRVGESVFSEKEYPMEHPLTRAY